MRKLATLSLGLVAVLAAACSSSGCSVSGSRVGTIGRPRPAAVFGVRPPPRPRCAAACRSCAKDSLALADAPAR